MYYLFNENLSKIYYFVINIYLLYFKEFICMKLICSFSLFVCMVVYLFIYVNNNYIFSLFYVSKCKVKGLIIYNLKKCNKCYFIK